MHYSEASTHPSSPQSDVAAEPGWDVLGSALAADALDVLGYRHQCLNPEIRPLTLSQRMIGRAFPVRSLAATDPTPSRPYEGLLAALDDLSAGSVFVLATDRSDAAGVWGELITTACVATGVVGAVTDGLIRDVTRVLNTGFPVFSRGATPNDSKGRVDVVEHGVPLVLDGVRIAPGDLVIGDADGVCIVPAHLESQVLELVREKHDGEGRFRDAVGRGMRVSDAFRQFGIL